MIISARLTFSAAHRLHNPDFDDDWNRRTYDKCDNPSGHGHNYALQVSVRGNIDPKTGHILGDTEAQALWAREYRPGWEPKI